MKRSRRLLLSLVVAAVATGLAWMTWRHTGTAAADPVQAAWEAASAQGRGSYRFSSHVDQTLVPVAGPSTEPGAPTPSAVPWPTGTASPTADPTATTSPTPSDDDIAVVPGGRQRHHVDVGSSTYGPCDRDEARRIIDEGDGSDQDFQQLREEGVLPSRLPRTMVGATAGLVAFSLGLTVVAGPAFGYTERTAQDLLDRQVYRSAVLSEASR